MKEVTAADWAEATATTPLNMAEMDKLIAEREKAWEEYDEKRKVSAAAMEVAELLDAKLMQALKDAGKSKYHVDGLGTISLQQKSVVRVPGTIESKKVFFKHLRERGEEVLLSMATVNSNTLNSWYNQQLDEASAKGILGFSVPGIDQPTMRETLRFNKERSKNGKGSQEG